MDSFAAVHVSTARSLDDLHRVFMIRAIVFMAEQECPFDEEYDGNDLACLHLIARIDGEPVGTLRLRWFAGFGKIERVCILPRARGHRLDRILLAHALEIAARKGYRLMIGQIQARLWPLWSRVLHCHLQEDRAKFSFSDFEYLEIHIPVPRHPDALSPTSDPYVLIRPEGDWDRRGILEASTDRTVADKPGRAA
ncbi:GNAT family N-acetyltransferase [Henriciella litoralis]|uniref:GNAT family N-acetyltransferase n=1 Tax=Henriciella litoralis TaxID=568102 RepID=UPI001F451D83|nr:GNAT family N-acetyltransferase [Henriciella litoralis]